MVKQAFLRFWWFGLVALGWVVVAWLRLNSVDVGLFRVDSRGTLLSLLGLWLVFCIWILAGFDLAVRVRLYRRGIGFIALPGAVGMPAKLRPWIVFVGFVLGIIVGHFAW